MVPFGEDHFMGSIFFVLTISMLVSVLAATVRRSPRKGRFRALANCATFMKKALIVACAMALCGGCSGGGGSVGLADRAAVPAIATPDLPLIEHALFVSDLGNEVFVLRGTPYHVTREITHGVHGSDGLWVDKHGNLYVSNINAKSVTEYLRGGRVPICRYSDHLIDPIDVTTDDEGNVYVVDFNDFRTTGYIDVYPQCHNKTIARHAIVTGPEGVAVSAAGDVFVAYYNGAFGGFEEFLKGKAKPKLLKASITKPGGIVLDRKGNLIADDQAGSIDIIAPPYANPKLLVGGLYDPFRLALNKDETRLFSADSGSASVTIYSYPDADLLETISGGSITIVEGVAISPDAVF
jgi:DNA-binding beta-propeller fold protein YncE